MAKEHKGRILRSGPHVRPRVGRAERGEALWALRLAWIAGRAARLVAARDPDAALSARRNHRTPCRRIPDEIERLAGISSKSASSRD